MGSWETIGKSDNWRTPKYVFDALAASFDLDVAGTFDGSDNTPANEFLRAGALDDSWSGFVWMNPPFGKRNGVEPWLDKFFEHARKRSDGDGGGIALVPDRTSAPWFQRAAKQASLVLFVSPRIRFDYFDEKTVEWKVGKTPGCGTALLAANQRAVNALVNARVAGLGWLCHGA